jgi:hypothetical protein
VIHQLCFQVKCPFSSIIDVQVHAQSASPFIQHTSELVSTLNSTGNFLLFYISGAALGDMLAASDTEWPSVQQDSCRYWYFTALYLRKLSFGVCSEREWDYVTTGGLQNEIYVIYVEMYKKIDINILLAADNVGLVYRSLVESAQTLAILTGMSWFSSVLPEKRKSQPG